MEAIYRYFFSLSIFTVFFFSCRTVVPSEDSYTMFCEVLENALNDRDKSWIDGHFDSQFVIEKVTEGIDEAPDYYRQGFEEGFTNLYTPGTILSSALGENGNVKFLGMKSLEPPVALYRLISEGGLNYQEISLAYDKNGEIYIKDFYSLLEGEWFSQGIRRLYIINLASEIDGFDHPLAQAAPLVDEIGQMADNGEVQAAFDKLINVSPEVLKEKIILLILMNLGQDLGRTSLDEAVDVFKKVYPDDPLVELKEMEFAFMNDESKEKVLLTLDNLEGKVGQDPYINLLRGVVYLKNEDIGKAQELFSKVVEEEPDNEEAYWSLIDLLIQTEQYDETLVLFQRFQEAFDQNPADYIIYDGYNDFYNSIQYQKWIEAYPLEGNPNLKMDSIIQAVEKIMEEGEEHSHDHNH